MVVLNAKSMFDVLIIGNNEDCPLQTSENGERMKRIPTER